MAENSYSQLMTSLVTSTKALFPATTVGRSNQGNIEPNKPYISIKIIRDTQAGSATQDTLLNEDSESRTIATYTAVVQFSFTSIDEDAAGDLAKTFVQYMNTSLTREVFRANKLSKLSVSVIRNVPYLRESVWTQYFNVDVTFAYSVTTTQVMTPIETVEITDLLSGEVFTVPPDVIITP